MKHESELKAQQLQCLVNTHFDLVDIVNQQPPTHLYLIANDFILKCIPITTSAPNPKQILNKLW